MRPFFILSLAMLPAIAVCQTQSQGSSNSHRRSTPPSWDVKYKAGTLKLKEDSWLKATFVPRETVQTRAPSDSVAIDKLRDRKQQSTPVIAIAPDQLRTAYFDPKAEKDSALMQSMPRSGCHYAESLMPKDKTASAPEVFVISQASPGAFSRGLGRLDRRHPIQLTWAMDNSHGEAVLQLKDCEYASFLAGLRRFAGGRWTEIEQESKK